MERVDLVFVALLLREQAQDRFGDRPESVLEIRPLGDLAGDVAIEPAGEGP